MRNLLVVLLIAGASAAAEPAGVLPVGPDGRALNLDFETGDLRDWLANGEAFEGQPIKGDTVRPRRRDMRSEHQGNYWIGGFEKNQDPPQGTLTSAPFRVTHPYAAFLVGGGAHRLATCVELVRRDTQKVFFRAAGKDRENLERVVVDLQPHQGKEIFIRIVDRHAGHWGHINFDDFRFYPSEPKFAPPKRVIDLLAHQGLPADRAAEVMTVPEGFKVTAMASEPDVRQPIAMTIDERGRLWVAEAYTYPARAPAGKGRDRILIFEDADGDGKFEKPRVFVDNLNLVSGIEVGFGGVWVGQAPELLFIPDQNGDDKPDGPPEVVLDGWGYQDTHETLNSFIWGPDGWLYGCHGVFTHSLVGAPGTPPEKRIPINAGIWRFHPQKKKFEVFAYGTSNPWGVDFNDRGHAFLTCCVIPHLFHIIQGARYHRQGGSHFQPYTYADIQTIAKHRHWVGNQWNDADRARSDSQGGGHAHAGAMIYLGGAWPDKYRGQLFMNNIHGARLNVDRLSLAGSGYVGDGEPDFCKTNDLWSQILYLRYGPDGQVYMIDWYDRNQCHHNRPNDHDRSNGRVYRISYKDAKPVKVDLRDKSDLELVSMLVDRNDWYVRQARRLLQERAAKGKMDDQTRAAMARLAFDHADATRRLRGLWAIHVTGGLDDAQLLRALADADADVRSWAIQLACENGPPSAKALEQFTIMAQADASPVVRLYLASALQRLPHALQWGILKPLLDHAEDSEDHNLPLMYWYAIEPLAEIDTARAFQLASASKIPLVGRFMARRIAAIGTPEALQVVLGGVLEAKDAGAQETLLREVAQGLAGKTRVAMPPNWGTLFDRLGDSKVDGLRSVVWSLAVKFGDPTVRDRMRDLLARDTTPLEQRREFLATLLATGDTKLVPVMHSLIKEPSLRREALQGLASFDDAKTAEIILKGYASFAALDRRAALTTLAGRARYAKALLEAIGEKKIPPTDLTADLVRQMLNLRDPAISSMVEKVWGTVRQSPEDKLKQIAQYKRLITSSPAPPEMLSLGRAVFAKTCQQCHTLFDVGGKVGPDLTGSDRANLDYLLSNVIDPSAVLGKDYVAHVVETRKGQIVTGLIREQNKDAITVVTAEQTFTIPRSEIEEIIASDKSMMPDDLLKPLSELEVRALAGYLAGRSQTAMLATSDNAVSLFNGKDLTGWRGDPRIWKVEGGMIVGTRTTATPNRNEFLISDLEVRDFRLTFEVKLNPDGGNSGVQFRSEAIPGGDVKGYQADIGAGWWGKLYEEHGRGLLWTEPGDRHVKKGEWNQYEVVASGDSIRTYINGQLCADLTDSAGRKQGVLALQVHSGEPFQVYFRNLKLEVLTAQKP